MKETSSNKVSDELSWTLSACDWANEEWLDAPTVRSSEAWRMMFRTAATDWADKLIHEWQTRSGSPSLRKIRRAIVTARPADISCAKLVLSYWLKAQPHFSELHPILNALPRQSFSRTIFGRLLSGQDRISLNVVRKICVRHDPVFLAVWAADMIEKEASAGCVASQLQKLLDAGIDTRGDIWEWETPDTLYNLWTAYGLPRLTRRSLRYLCIDLRRDLLGRPREMKRGILAEEFCMALEEDPFCHSDTPASCRLAEDQNMLATAVHSLQESNFVGWEYEDLLEFLCSPNLPRFERALLRALRARSKSLIFEGTIFFNREDFLDEIVSCPSPLLRGVIELITLDDEGLGVQISQETPEKLAVMVPLLSPFDLIRAAPFVTDDSAFWKVADHRVVLSAARSYGQRMMCQLQSGGQLPVWSDMLFKCWLSSLTPKRLASTLTMQKGAVLAKCNPALIDTLATVKVGGWLEAKRPVRAIDVLLSHENGILFLEGVVSKAPSIVEHLFVGLYERTSARWLHHRGALLRIIAEGDTSPVGLLPQQFPLQSAELAFLLTSAPTVWQNELLTRAAAASVDTWRAGLTAARQHRSAIDKKLQGRIADECPVAHQPIFENYPDLFTSEDILRTLPPELLCLGISRSAAYRSRLEAVFSRAELAGWGALSRDVFAGRPLLQACVELSLSFSLYDFVCWMELLKERMTAYHDGHYQPGRVFDTRYHTWSQPKKSGGSRLITAPDPVLKRIQKRLLRQGFEAIKLEPAAHGFRKELSPLTNAAPHVNRDLVVNVDIDKFFDSTGYALIVSAAGQLCNGKLSTHARMCVADICSHAGTLPTGAPTSPMIGNIILVPADRALTTLCERKGIVYTRYADDLTFSGDGDAKRVLPFVRKVLADYGYSLADKKTHLYRRGRQQVVTGLVVNEKVNCPRAFRRCLRAAVDHFCKGKTPRWHGKPMGRRQLVGRIALLKPVQPAEFAAHMARLASMGAKQ